MTGRIMIVDDEPNSLSVLERLLTDAGYLVSLFPRGPMAFEAADELRPDVILLDIRMPGMNGFEFCRQAQQTPALFDVPIIFISGLNSPNDLVEGFKAGAVDYITKPFCAEVVMARVRVHVALRQARQKLIDRNCELDEQVYLLRQVERGCLDLKLLLEHEVMPCAQATRQQVQAARDGTEPGAPALPAAQLTKAAHSAQLLTGMIARLLHRWPARVDGVDAPATR